jgi:hypothetical protein
VADTAAIRGDPKVAQRCADTVRLAANMPSSTEPLSPRRNEIDALVYLHPRLLWHPPGPKVLRSSQSSVSSIQGLPVAVFHHSPTELDVAVPVEALEHHCGLTDDSPARWREAFGELAAFFEAIGNDLLQVVPVRHGVVRIEGAFPIEYAPPQSFYFELSEHRPVSS